MTSKGWFQVDNAPPGSVYGTCVLVFVMCLCVMERECDVYV